MRRAPAGVKAFGKRETRSLNSQTSALDPLVIFGGALFAGTENGKPEGPSLPRLRLTLAKDYFCELYPGFSTSVTISRRAENEDELLPLGCSYLNAITCFTCDSS